MSEPLSKIPVGMKYYFGSQARLRRDVEDLAMAVFRGWSYEEIVTPTIDYYALFERGMGRSQAHRAFRFTDTDGRLLALRPDITSSVARAAATLFAERARPLRFCYAATVFHQRPRSHAEWRRETTHLGCELIGARGVNADLEVLLIAAEILRRLGLAGDYRITLNDVEVFNGVAENLKLDETAREHLRQLIDARNASELREFLAPYAPAEDCIAFAQLTRLAGKSEMFDRARHLIVNERSRRALENLEALWRALEALGLADSFEIDLGDVSELDYYTGLVFRIYVRGLGVRVGNGGRYDGLTANFGRAEPAIGFIFDLDSLTDVLWRRRGAQDAGDGGARLRDEDRIALFRSALRLREADERVLIEF
ncbi:ATP phosphoribosyltransferase regulatory subunit [Pyrinomonas methylaliphatogenes]|jgi:ATP phosphoribosyltransferase regulatory subunit|uniref:ATP phosphoribosyltransferase regulatory subunit n=1 Tax=Pyrinomonas methylaliphatogenes TaxID=454194 RepID=A0A0B6WUN4_9BACT|nr:ATP phosphoribosyltransferase regulatory subunit [Pyrinomonas methylaliphatogenes]MBX5479615.1 ATP phosphoribosyltransferase regulatory subunit [Pyrinomonas methylaliphatogenes]CDM64412.1 ATP phosphoribosyltransferase, regulatory subunit [Pyrinomonas methylaliphatogenes]